MPKKKRSTRSNPAFAVRRRSYAAGAAAGRKARRGTKPRSVRTSAYKAGWMHGQRSK